MMIVVNAGNVAGHVIDAFENRFNELNVPITFSIKIHHTPDGKSLNGIPNPYNQNQIATREAVLAHSADIGIAWDGDFDRCFFFDEQGNYIEGYLYRYSVQPKHSYLKSLTPLCCTICV